MKAFASIPKLNRGLVKYKEMNVFVSGQQGASLHPLAETIEPRHKDAAFTIPLPSLYTAGIYKVQP